MFRSDSVFWINVVPFSMMIRDRIKQCTIICFQYLLTLITFVSHTNSVICVAIRINDNCCRVILPIVVTTLMNEPSVTNIMNIVRRFVATQINTGNIQMPIDQIKRSAFDCFVIWARSRINTTCTRYGKS